MVGEIAPRPCGFRGCVALSGFGTIRTIGDPADLARGAARSEQILSYVFLIPLSGVFSARQRDAPERRHLYAMKMR